MIDVLHDPARPEKERCSICYCALPPGGAFCPYCAPPEEPVMVPDSTLSFAQTFLRIAFLMILFGGFVVYKMDLSLEEVMKEKPSADATIPIEEQAEDENFKVTHFVNAGMANVRVEPSFKGKIAMVLKRDERVVVQERQDRWTKIVAHGKSGWISNKLLDSRVE